MISFLKNLIIICKYFILANFLNIFSLYILLYESCLIGSGGREHAICTSLKNSNKLSKVYCIPGNAGTNFIAENVKIELNNFQKIKDFILHNKIDLVVIGPEKPLVEGMADYLRNYNIKVFGPNKIASQLEGSKIFTKNYVKVIKYQQRNLVFSEILMKQ